MSESERAAALRRYDLLDAAPEPQLDHLAELAARLFEAPVAVFSVQDGDRWLLKAQFGTDRSEVPSRFELAPFATSKANALVVLDAPQETGMRDHPLVAGPPFLRFYASAPVRSPDGHMLGVIAVVDTRPRADVSAGRLTGLEALARLAESELERRLMARRLTETAERYRDLAEVSSDWVWETDEAHRLADMVANHPALVGIVRSGMGMCRWELDEAQPLRGAWADHIADLDARREFRGFEYEARTAAGARRVFRISGRPRFDARGRFLGYRGTGADVTQRRAEELARALNQRLFETSVDLILAMDAKGGYVLVSPSATSILGYTPKELVDRSGVDIVHPDDLNRVRNEMRLARRGKAVRQFNCRCVRKDGRVVPMSIVDVWSEVDQHHFFIGRDMTEHLAAEERQRQSQRLEALGQLTGGIAHDFNNILSIATLKMESVLEDLPVDSPYRRRLELALAAGGRGADLVSRLMTFARRRPLAPTVHAVGALLEGLAGLIQTALSTRIPLTLEVTDDLPRCRIDRTGLETAILNLAVNARDAMPDGGQLYISACRRIVVPQDVETQPQLRAGDWVEIAVRDTGTGMPPETQAKVFEPFFTTKGEGKGTGLGLAMVNGFVHQSDGFVTLKSTVGSGSTFALYLPAIAMPTALPVAAVA